MKPPNHFWRKNISEVQSPSLKEKEFINIILEKVSLLKLAKEEAEWFFNSYDPRKISSILPQGPSVIVTD